MSDLAPQSARTVVWCLLIAATAQAIAAPTSTATAEDTVATQPPAQAAPSPAPAEAPATAEPAPTAPSRTPRIIYQGRVVPYRPASEYERRRPDSRRRGYHRRSPAVIAPAAPATLPEPATPPATLAGQHAAAAERYAYQHFRYKFRVGSTHYAITALDILPEETVEVAGWNQYRTTGEAGIEYYDNASLKRTVRRFEIVTETKDGRIVPVEITVK